MALRVLIADDEWITAFAMSRLMESHGHEVIATVGTGQQALETCCSAMPDLVLMDVQMPRMNGLEAARGIMQRRPTCIMVVTGDGTLERAAEQAGAMGYVIKPLRNHEIPSVVELARRRFGRFTAVSRAVGDADETMRVWLLARTAVRQLVDSGHLSEEQAFDRLEGIATERGLSLAVAAETIAPS